MKRLIGLAWRHARRTVIMITGVIIVTIGIIGFFLPVLPGLVIVPLGLALLATEFLWARRLLNKIREKAGFPSRPDPAPPCTSSAGRDEPASPRLNLAKPPRPDEYQAISE